MKIILIALALSVSACSYDRVDLVEQPREREFYEPFINSQRSPAAAKDEMPTLKLLKINGLYDGRFALYDNGQFYYDINHLGDGMGNWTFENGALKLKAGRMFFDLIFTVSGASTEGTNTVVRFIDRNGAQRMDIQYQNMSACIQENKSCTLGAFEPSGKGL